MKKLLSSALAFVMALSLASCGNGNSPSGNTSTPVNPGSSISTDSSASGEIDHTKGETIAWKFGHGQTEDNPAVVATIAFADAIKEATDGRWTIDVYAGGSLGSELEVLEMTRVNTVQLFIRKN